MGDEVEAAIYNDGRQASSELIHYVNRQMNRILSVKMNQQNLKLDSSAYDKMRNS